MKQITCMLLGMLMLLAACKKSKEKNTDTDFQKDLQLNSSKVTITNGVWGTVSKRQGDCMPMVGVKNTCTEFTVQRQVRIYSYTTLSNAVPAYPSNTLYDSFNTQLIKRIDSDEKGFFQAELPDGKYTIVIVENGKLYASGLDGQGGIAPVEIINNNKVMANLVLNYAVY